MARRGYDPLWVLIAVPLGLLFLPIALERIQRRPDVAAFGAKGAPPRRSADPAAGPRVLVGLDDSVHSDRALKTALDLIGPRCELLVLAEVVTFDATETVSGSVIDAASARLAEMAAKIEIPGTVCTEVLTGPPGPTLRKCAEGQDMDLIVVGRRGRGRSPRLLGSVSAELVEHSPIPVLVIAPMAEESDREAVN